MKFFIYTFILLIHFHSFGQCKIGDSLMPYVAKDINSVPQSILQYQNSLLLVSVWASNCRPCRRYANPWVMQMYHQYHAKGLEVYSISIDNQIADWNYALVKDSCAGMQVIANGGWQSEFVRYYQVRNIPQKFLFYKGVLILKNKSMSEIENKIKDIIAMEKANK